MKRNKWLKVRVSEKEMEKLKRFARIEGWNISTAVRELIKNLPGLE